MKKIGAFILIFILYCNFIKSQHNTWYQYHGETSIQPSWSVSHAFQFRSSDILPQAGTYFLLAGINYQEPRTHLKVRLAYNEIVKRELNPESKSWSDLHTASIQVKYANYFNNLQHTSYLRLEEIWKGKRYDKAVLRGLLQINLPIAGDMKSNGGWYLSTFGELFLNISESKYERSRLYFGLGYVLNQHVKIQLGNMQERKVPSVSDQWMITVIHKG